MSQPAGQPGQMWGGRFAGQLDPAFAEEFLNFIVAEVIRHHEKLADESK